ncbi:MAG: response regulator transcription factor [Actinomycetota bacterium]|nr:response regulator transcription factor [Actinomycetota bacterium]
MVTVIVAHERRLMRQALAKILTLQNQISVVGDAASGPDAVAKAEELMPDVIVVDSVLPGLNGMLGREKSQRDRPEVVVFPSREKGDDDSTFNHLTYDDDINDLVEAVLGAAGHAAGEETRSLTRTALSKLTKREQQVLPLLADGLSNKQIAQRMTITERTVKYHISNILRKLDIFSRTEAAVAFLRNSLNES